MNRNLTIQRIYSLGNYKNLQVTDSINDVPEELMLNEDFVRNLRLLQLLRCDQVYYDYITTSPAFVDGMKSEQALEFIERASVSTTEAMKKSIASLGEDKEAEIKKQLGYDGD